MPDNFKAAVEKCRRIIREAGCDKFPSPLGDDDNAAILRAALCAVAGGTVEINRRLFALSKEVARHGHTDRLKEMFRVITLSRVMVHEIARLAGAHPDVDSNFWRYVGRERVSKYLEEGVEDASGLLDEPFDADIPAASEFTPEAFERASAASGKGG